MKDERTGLKGTEPILMSFRLFWHIIAIRRRALPRGVFFGSPRF